MVWMCYEVIEDNKSRRLRISGPRYVVMAERVQSSSSSVRLV